MTYEYVVVALLVILPLVAVIRFEVFCLSDLADTSDADLMYLTRSGWLVLIALAIPIGGIAYLYYGKPR